MVAVPGGVVRLDAAVTTPVLLTVATVWSEEVQVAFPLTSLVLPSSNPACAVTFWVCFRMIDAEVGFTVSDVTLGVTKKP